MKKSLIFWFAAVTCAALFLIGCDNGTTTETVTNTVNVGAAADIEGLQALLAEPGVNQVTYYGDLTITGGELVSVPEGKTLTVTGGITLASGTDVLVVAGGLNFTGTIANSGVVIGVAADKVSGGTRGELVSGLDDPKIGTVSAMKDYPLTSNASAIPSSLTLYVYGDLTVAADSVAPTGGGKVVAIGTVTLAGDNAAALADAAKVDVSRATIVYTGSGAANVTLPNDLKVFAFKVTNEQGLLKVTGGTTGITAAVTPNNGYVEFVSAVTQATITGSGRVRFLNGTTPTAFATLSDITASVIDFPNGFSYGAATLALSGGNVLIGNTKAATATGGNTLTLGSGTVVKTGADYDVTLLTAVDEVEIMPTSGAILTFTAATGLALSTQGVEFGGDVVFGGDLTVDGVTAEFGGTAYFAATKKITLADDSSAIKLAGVAGALAVGAPVANVPDIYHTVLIGNDSSDGGTLTAGTENGATLTFAATGITQDSPSTNDHGITITNKVAVIPLKSYTVASASSKKGTLTVDTGAVLTLDAGVLADYDIAPEGKPAAKADWVSKLVLTGATSTDGAKLDGAGSVVAGGTTIVGGTNGWQAVGATGGVTIAADAISADTSVLTAVTGDTQPSITVAVDSTLTIAGEIALGGSSAKVGSIVLTYSDTPAKIAFKEAGAKISTGNGAGTKVSDDIAGGITANSGTVGAELEVYSSSGTGSALKLGHITPASSATFNGTDNVITGPTATANTSIDGTLTVTAS